MKVIMNGKVYNTETAKNLGDREYTDGVNSFSYVKEALYKKKTGEFFLYECNINRRHALQRITKLTGAAAKKWTEEHLTADEYMKIFGGGE